MRLPDIGSQYLTQTVDSKGAYLHGSKAYKVRLPSNSPVGKFWSFTVYDSQTRSMLDTPQRYPRAGSQSYPSPVGHFPASYQFGVGGFPAHPESGPSWTIRAAIIILLPNEEKK